jgi:hypothetical protein
VIGDGVVDVTAAGGVDVESYPSVFGIDAFTVVFYLFFWFFFCLCHQFFGFCWTIVL